MPDVHPVTNFRRRVGEVIRTVLLGGEPPNHLSELLVAEFTLIVGAVFLWPGSTFHRASVYTDMGKLASEDVWGVIYLVLGVMLFGGVVGGISGWLGPIGRKLRGGLLLASVAFQAFVSVIWFLGNPLALNVWWGATTVLLAVRSYFVRDRTLEFLERYREARGV